MDILIPLLPALAAIAAWLIGIAMIFIVPINRKPSSATAWLLLIFIAPFLGLLIFLMIGYPRLNRHRRAQQRKMDQLVAEVVDEISRDPRLQPYIDPPLTARFAPLAHLTEYLGSMPAFAGNQVELVSEYDEIIQRIAADIDQAQVYVHIAFYIIALDKTSECVFAAMERAVARGVPVRVLFDQIGSRKYPRRREMERRMSERGIEWHYMLPVKPLSREWNRLDLRNHRKIVVVDGEIGYTGSLNLIERAYHRPDDMYYDELVARVTGPVVVQLDAVFVTDWMAEAGVLLSGRETGGQPRIPEPTGEMLCQVLPSGSGHDNENNLRLFTAMIHNAQKSLIVVNPYFVPDDALMLAITSAAQRGVDVTMINSEAPDQFMVYHAQRSYYEELLRAGVKLRLYKRPILLHSKFMIIDDDIAMIGSSNMDMRSFQLNLEVSLSVYNRELNAQLRAVADAYLARCIPLELAEWRRRPLRVVLFNNLARLTAALQ